MLCPDDDWVYGFGGFFLYCVFCWNIFLTISGIYQLFKTEKSAVILYHVKKKKI